MASECRSTPKEEEEEEEFGRMLKRIGGKGKIYLVGDADGENNCSLFQEFILDMFHTEVHIKRDRNANLGNGNLKPVQSPVTEVARTEGDSKHEPISGQVNTMETILSHKAPPKRLRRLHCAVIIFIFRHGYIHNKANRVLMEEILKDVKARVKKSHGARQALLGLVRADAECSETQESVTILEETLRSVFIKHPRDSIWTGHFIPNAAQGIKNIKRNVCKAVSISQSPENILSRKRYISWPSLRRWMRRGQRERADVATRTHTHNDDPESKEEGIPLQTKSDSVLTSGLLTD